MNNFTKYEQIHIRTCKIRKLLGYSEYFFVTLHIINTTPLKVMYKIFYFLPSIVCALWTLTFLAVRKTHRQKLLTVILMFSCMYYVTYAFLTSPTDDAIQELYLYTSKAESFGLPLIMIVLALLAAYIQIHITGERLKPSQMLYLGPPMMYTAAYATLYFIIGYDDAADFMMRKLEGMELLPEHHTRLYDTFYFFQKWLTMGLSLLGMITILALCVQLTKSEGYRFGDFCRFVFKGQRSTPSRLVSISIIFIILLMIPVAVNHVYLKSHPALGIALAMAISIAIHFLSFGEYHSRTASFDKSLFSSQQSEKEDSSPLLGTTNELSEQDSLVQKDNLQERFEELMVTKRRYLDSDLLIADVAMELNVGRTTLSAMINMVYGKNFRSVVNEYRIAYAKDYLKSHPLDKLEQVAFACGFKDASAFSHKFKELVGKPPMLWQVSGA